MPEGRCAGVALGSNLPQQFETREAALRAAVARVSRMGEVLRVSSFVDTAPVGLLEQPRFLNGALLLRTELEPGELLRGLLEIEREMGRVREGVPAKGPRVVDLDLLFLDGMVVRTAELTLPHAALAERRFVLEPLAEIAPGWTHPVLGLTVEQMLGRLAGAVEGGEMQGVQLGGLPTEARNPRTERLDEMSTVEMLTAINDEDATIAAAVCEALPKIAEAVDEISERFRRGGRLLYVGAGTSGRLGVLDASECPPTFSVDAGLFVGMIAGGDGALRRSSEGSEDDPREGSRDLAAHRLTERDTVLGIAASGRTPYVLGALDYATRAGALTVALTCAGGGERPSAMSERVLIAIELATGPEVLTGSTRMKAGTATKMVLNMISTAVMVRGGAVYGNLMVNVQPSNAKLVDRAERMIVAATGCELEKAGRLLKEAGSVKVAIAMQMLGVDAEVATARLQASEGRLGEVLGQR